MKISVQAREQFPVTRRAIRPLCEFYLRAETPGVDHARLADDSLDFCEELLACGGVAVRATGPGSSGFICGFAVGIPLRNNRSGFAQLTALGISAEAFEVIALITQGFHAAEARRALLAELTRIAALGGQDSLVMLAPRNDEHLEEVMDLGFSEAAVISAPGIGSRAVLGKPFGGARKGQRPAPTQAPDAAFVSGVTPGPVSSDGGYYDTHGNYHSGGSGFSHGSIH